MEIIEYPLTFLILILTILTSWRAFESPELRYKTLFIPDIIERRKEWYRFISHGFIHADFIHLAFNMLSFWSFGRIIESFFKAHFGLLLGSLFFLLLYFLSMIAAAIPSFLKHRHNSGYSALGASGAVSGVLMGVILLFPFIPIQFFFIPIDIPGVLFAVLYLAYSSYAAQHANDNIGHDAHFFGAIFGILFTLALDFSTFSSMFVHGIERIFN